ncbi:Virulence factor BrkB (plasmid) [Streptomyces sp. CA-256286]|nr:Virulence factor BrkB [Streptomyces sp. CA-256286]
MTPGSFLALVIWLATSADFAFYVANFASYNKTYGALAGVVVFLVWLWITSLAILQGLEFDAEMVRPGDRRRPSQGQGAVRGTP